MRGYLLAAVVTAAATLTGSITADGVPAGAAVQDRRTAPGTQLWSARVPTSSNGLSDAMVVSPDGGTVYVTGEVYLGQAFGPGFRTTAYRAATGKPLWVSRYHGPTKGRDTPEAMAVSPDGATVFVTGSSPRRRANDYATVAYRATTGEQLWVSRYKSQTEGANGADAIAVSPDGATVYVTGMSRPTRTSNFSYATIAYNAVTGRQLWASRYGPGKNLDNAESIAVSPDGSRVFVTGISFPRFNDGIYTTLAYSAATGKQLWASRYGAGKIINDANSMAVNPEGTTVFVTGTSDNDSATIAYDAATGQQRWARRYPDGSWPARVSLALNPSGSNVFVAGTGKGGFTAVAYRAATGKELWASSHSGYEAHSIAVSPHGTAVYVTGYGRSQTGYDTVSFSAATGKQLWTGRDHGPGTSFGSADSIVAGPDGRVAFVTGWVQISSQNPPKWEYLTIAFRS